MDIIYRVVFPIIHRAIAGIVGNISVIVKGKILVCLSHILSEKRFEFRKIIGQIALCVNGNKLLESILNKSFGNIGQFLTVFIIPVDMNTCTTADINYRFRVAFAGIIRQHADRSDDHCEDYQA